MSHKPDKRAVIIFAVVFVLVTIAVSFGAAKTYYKKAGKEAISVGGYKINYEPYQKSIFPKLFFSPNIDGRQATGLKNAKLTFVVYLNPGSSASRDFHENIFPQLKKEFIDTGIISFYPKNFVTEDEVEKDSLNVAYALWLECISDIKPEKYWEFYDNLFKTQPDNPALILKDIGISGDDFDYCMRSSMFAHLKEDIKEVEDFGINIVPAVYIGVNGKDNTIIQGTGDYAQLRRAILFASAKVGA